MWYSRAGYTHGTCHLILNSALHRASSWQQLMTLSLSLSSLDTLGAVPQIGKHPSYYDETKCWRQPKMGEHKK